MPSSYTRSAFGRHGVKPYQRIWQGKFSGAMVFYQRRSGLTYKMPAKNEFSPPSFKIVENVPQCVIMKFEVGFHPMAPVYFSPMVGV
jgi:hypothetical protein